MGFRIQRQPKRGSGKLTVYTYPSKAALCWVKAKVRSATRQGLNQPLAVRLCQTAPVLQGWAIYFRYGVSKATFDYLRRFTWRRVICWQRHKHRHASWKWLRHRYLPRWWLSDGTAVLFDIGRVTVSRYPTGAPSQRRGQHQPHEPNLTRARGEPDAVQVCAV